jgi:hypothetical protein
MTSLDEQVIALREECTKQGRDLIDFFSPKEILEACSWKFHEKELGDPLAFSNGKKMLVAMYLGHEYVKDDKGVDGVDQNGYGCIYKTTTQVEINAAYHGISYKKTGWDDQVKYLWNEKIARWTHYFARFHEGQMVELWKMDGRVVFELLLPKVQDLYEIWVKGNRRIDNRCNVPMSRREIIQHGIKLALVNNLWR